MFGPQPPPRVAGVVQGFPHGFQTQPFLRVHPLGLARGDAEQQRIEAVHLAEVAAVHERARPAGPGALGRDRADRAHSGAQQLPEVGDVVGAGEPAGQADDGNRLGCGPARGVGPG